MQSSVILLIARRKSRYLLVEASRDADLVSKEGQRGLSDGLARALGDIGYMNSSPRVMHQVARNAFIMRVARGEEGNVVLALSFIKQLNGSELGFYTIRASGSIRKLDGLAATLYGAVTPPGT